MENKTYMVFDVESIGLHGEAFAVGWVVVNHFGETLDKGLHVCDSSQASGTPESRKWVAENVPPMTVNCASLRQMRDTFWEHWMLWKNKGAVLVADCAWPVEARFLNACVDDDHAAREWHGPYPFIDLGSVLLATGRDPLATYPRSSDELPAHNPLSDAMQSARILITCIFHLSLACI